MYYCSDNPNGFVTGKRYSVDKPCVTIMAAGMGGDWLHHWRIVEEPGDEVMTQANLKRNAHSEKPTYRVPLMTEIAALPWNGYTVASTFSGCGGSCLGYRMAGFRVAWANEFVPAAQESYLANASPDCYLDKRDIKVIRPEEILEQLKMKPGDLDLFDGSPPCQAFSTAGQREKGWGKNKTYEHGASQKNETLFDEYIRLLRGLKPKTFIAENVSGLIKGTAKGFFLEILKALKESGYRVACRELDAQWLGVPQQRHRIIFQGVREDLIGEPSFPTPLKYRYTVREAMLALHKAIPQSGLEVTHEVKGGYAPDGSWKKKTINIIDRPSTTIVASGSGADFEVKFDAVTDVVHDTGNWVRNKSIIDTPAPCITNGGGGSNSGHFKVMHREGGYRTQEVIDEVCPTILASSNCRMHAVNISDGESVRRKFTIDEVKSICSFPYDFELKGSYAQQWERMGNSVPPVMMKHIAEAVRDKVLRPNEVRQECAA